MEVGKIKTTDLRLARVKYFDTKHNGAELSKTEAYAFLRKAGDHYFNVFDVLEDLPVLDRYPYANVLSTGEEYGNKLVHVQGELVDGPCYVIEPFSAKSVLRVDEISEQELREYVLHSRMFFVDRLKMLEDEPGIVKMKNVRTILADRKNMERLKAEFANHENGKPYIK